MRSPTDEARRWLTHAQDEYGDAEDLRERERFYLALFHFQQAAEKALKAFLYAHTDDRQVFFTHSVLELVQAAVVLDPSLADLEECRPVSILIPMRPPKHRPWPARSLRPWLGDWKSGSNLHNLRKKE
jgi:hypothetical protein